MPRKRMSSKRIAEAIKIQLKITADGLRGRLEQFTFDPKGEEAQGLVRLAELFDKRAAAGGLAHESINLIVEPRQAQCLGDSA